MTCPRHSDAAESLISAWPALSAPAGFTPVFVVVSIVNFTSVPGPAGCREMRPVTSTGRARGRQPGAVGWPGWSCPQFHDRARHHWQMNWTPRPDVNPPVSP
jgi:hypothetical protein